MPNPQTVKRHGGIRTIRRRKVDATTVIVVYTFQDGKKYNETRRMVPVKKRQARVAGKKSTKRNTYFPR
jgi:hypothetical protein